MRETLTLDLTVPDEFCCICRKLPRCERLQLSVVYEGEPAEVSICRDCMAEYAPEMLAEIEAAAGLDRASSGPRSASD